MEFELPTPPWKAYTSQDVMKISPPDFRCSLRLALVLTITLLPSVLLTEANGAEVNGITAKVNGRVITKNQVSFLLAPKLRVLEERFPDKGAEFTELLAKAQKGVLQELVDRQTMIDKFDHLKIKIAPEKVEEEVQREIRDVYQGNPNLLLETLKASRMTMEGYRSLLRERLLESEIRKQIPQEE